MKFGRHLSDFFWIPIVAWVVAAPLLAVLIRNGGTNHAVVNPLGFALIVGVYAAVERLALKTNLGKVHRNYVATELPLLAGLFLLHPLAHLLARFIASGAGTAWRLRNNPRVPSPKAAFVNASIGTAHVAAFSFLVHVLGFRNDFGSKDLLIVATGWCVSSLVEIGVPLVGQRIIGERVSRLEITEAITDTALLGFPTMLFGLLLAMLFKDQSFRAVVVAMLFGCCIGALLRFMTRVLLRSQAHSRLDEFFSVLQIASHENTGELIDTAAAAIQCKGVQLVLLDRPVNGVAPTDAVTVISSGGSTVAPLSSLPLKWLDVLSNGVLSTEAAVQPKKRTGRIGTPSQIVCPLTVNGLIVGLLICTEQQAVGKHALTVASEVVPKVGSALSLWLEQDRLISSLRHETIHDPLTGLLNRRGWFEKWNDLVAEGTDRAAIFAIDLDRFSEANSHLGHAGGDRVLADVGVRLREALPPRSIIARLGGDEFVAAIPGVREGDADSGALKFGLLIRKALAQPHEYEDKKIEVGGSIGIALWPDHGADIATVQKCADANLYGAKDDELGVASQGMNAYYQGSDSFDNHKLQAAIENGDIIVYYQPIIEMATSTVAGFELLARWQNGKTMVMPSQFIPIAERTNTINDLTVYMMKNSFPNIVRWSALAGRDLHVAVNFSTKSIANPMVLEALSKNILANKLPASSVHVEVTETHVLKQPVRAGTHLQHLQSLGVKVSLDDFGTGHSSFEWLLRLGADQLKIDRVFIKDISNDDKTREVVRLQQNMATTFGMTSVAEGVETIAQWQYIKEIGVTHGQGYLFGRPMPVHDIDRWLIEEAPRLLNTLNLAASMPHANLAAEY